MKNLQIISYKLQISYALAILLSYGLLTAQTTAPNYHPYECAQEELFVNSLVFRERHESNDCGTVLDLIGRFNSADVRGDEKEKFDITKCISFFPCREAYHFLETQIKNSSSETDRCNAMINLAWMRNPDKLPLVLEYYRKPSLSIHEKAAVATALMIYGTTDSLPSLIAQSVSILNEIGDDCPEDMLEYCILSYYLGGGNAALNFFGSQLEQEEYRLYAALFLAELGEYETTFPIFAEALSSNDDYDLHLAILGLATIGTEAAMQLVLNLPPEKNRYSPKPARWNFDCFNININERR